MLLIYFILNSKRQYEALFPGPILNRPWRRRRLHIRRVWRYQRGNQNPYIEEEETTQWPKGKIQRDKQRSTNHTYKPKDRVPRTPLNTGGEFMCSGRVSSSCSTSYKPCDKSWTRTGMCLRQMEHIRIDCSPSCVVSMVVSEKPRKHTSKSI
jgi:hypothetical protein